MITFKGVNHVALATNDMDETIRFWRDLLGMRLVAGQGKQGNRQYFFQVARNCYVSFFEWPNVTAVDDKDPGRPFKGPLSLDHLCISLASEDDLWALKERLEAAEVWTTEVLDHGFIHSFFSTDPNNIQIEFCVELKGIDLGREPRMVDSQPTDAAMEGPEPRSDRWPPVYKPVPPENRTIYRGELISLREGKNTWKNIS